MGIDTARTVTGSVTGTRITMCLSVIGTMPCVSVAMLCRMVLGMLG